MQLDTKAERKRWPACAFGGHLWLTVTIYEEVRFVHANSADLICGKWPNIQFSWLQFCLGLLA